MPSIQRCKCGVKLLGEPGDVCRTCRAQLYPDTGIIFRARPDAESEDAAVLEEIAALVSAPIEEAPTEETVEEAVSEDPVVDDEKMYEQELSEEEQYEQEYLQSAGAHDEYSSEDEYTEQTEEEYSTEE